MKRSEVARHSVHSKVVIKCRKFKNIERKSGLACTKDHGQGKKLGELKKEKFSGLCN